MERNVSIKKNIIYNVIKTLSTIVFPLITFPYISRILLTENVGKYNFSTTFVSYFSLIATLGVTTYAIRICSQFRDDREKLSEISSQIFSINIISTLISYAILIGILIFVRSLDSYRTLVIILSTSILFTTLGADWINSALEDFKYITIRTFIFQFISLLLMFIFVRQRDDYINYAIITVISSSGGNILNIFYRRKYCKIVFTFHINWRKHIPPIFFLAVMTLSQTVLNGTSTTILGFVYGDYEVGIYSTALKIQQIVNQVVSSLLWVFMPRLSYLFRENKIEEICVLLSKIFGIFTLIGFPCIAGVCSIADDIILIVAGEAYIEATIPLIVLMLSFFFSLLGGSFIGNMTLLPAGREKTYMVICLLAAIVNIVISYFLILYFGAMGAAFATAITSFIICIATILVKDKQLKLQGAIKTMMAPLIGSVAIVGYCIAIKYIGLGLLWESIITISGGVIIYITIVLLLRNYYALEIIKGIQKRVLRKKDEKNHEK